MMILRKNNHKNILIFKYIIYQKKYLKRLSFKLSIMTTKSFLIYEIHCKNPDIKDLYVGSTTNLKQRLKSHKTCVNNPTNPHYNFKLYKTIRDNGGWDNWEAKEIEKLENVSKIEARIREEEVSKMLGAKLNMCKAYRSSEQAKAYYDKGSEWYKANHERAKKRYKDMCKKIVDLEKENNELKEQLESINNILNKS